MATLPRLTFNVGGISKNNFGLQYKLIPLNYRQYICTVSHQRIDFCNCGVGEESCQEGNCDCDDILPAGKHVLYVPIFV